MADQRAVSGKGDRRSGAGGTLRWTHLLQLAGALAGTPEKYTAAASVERGWGQNLERLVGRRGLARRTPASVVRLYGRLGPPARRREGHLGLQQPRHGPSETRTGDGLGEL